MSSKKKLKFFKKDKNKKTFSINEQQIAMLLFFFRPFRERQAEMVYWMGQLDGVKREVIKTFGLDPDKWIGNWDEAYKTGKLVLTKLPEPKNAKTKTNKK